MVGFLRGKAGIYHAEFRGVQIICVGRPHANKSQVEERGQGRTVHCAAWGGMRRPVPLRNSRLHFLKLCVKLSISWFSSPLRYPADLPPTGFGGSDPSGFPPVVLNQFSTGAHRGPPCPWSPAVLGRFLWSGNGLFGVARVCCLRKTAPHTALLRTGALLSW